MAYYILMKNDSHQVQETTTTATCKDQNQKLLLSKSDILALKWMMVGDSNLTDTDTVSQAWTESVLNWSACSPYMKNHWLTGQKGVTSTVKLLILSVL